MLGMNYGMGVRSLAAGTGLSPIHAQRLHQQLKRTYEVFGQWSRRVIDTGCCVARSPPSAAGAPVWSRAPR